MTILKITGHQTGFSKIEFTHYLLDRTAMTLKQARVASENVAHGEAVEIDVIAYGDQDFDQLNKLGTEFEVVR